MNLVTLQSQLDNSSFFVLLVTMLLYWLGAAFPAIPY
ncbi:MAG: c-type cytochrome biogenesis protein CcsB, partial [Symploca sp. SIO2C1]|nr:c-type cytochrome biogenesis protein CcsB [Symploca sp. SIO2C1]